MQPLSQMKFSITLYMCGNYVNTVVIVIKQAENLRTKVAPYLYLKWGNQNDKKCFKIVIISL